MGATVDASVAGTAALVVNAPRGRGCIGMLSSFMEVRSMVRARAAARSASPWVRGGAVSPPSASDFFGHESGDGVDFGPGESDARGGEVPVEVLDAGGAGDRERSGGAVKLPG